MIKKLKHEVKNLFPYGDVLVPIIPKRIEGVPNIDDCTHVMPEGQFKAGIDINSEIAKVEQDIKLFRDKKEITDKNIAVWTAYHTALGKREGLKLGKQYAEQETKKIFEKFDEYACIKDDKWYLELKSKIQSHATSRGNPEEGEKPSDMECKDDKIGNLKSTIALQEPAVSEKDKLIEQIKGFLMMGKNIEHHLGKNREWYVKREDVFEELDKLKSNGDKIV